MPLTKEELARERKFIQREKAMIQKPWLRRYTSPLERPETAMMPSEERSMFPGEIEVKESIEPAGPWDSVCLEDTVCAERPVNIVRENIQTKEETIVGFDIQRECVVLPNTKRCFIGLKPENFQERVAGSFACADETSGMLTTRQSACIAEVDEYDAKENMNRMKRENELQLVRGKPTPTWAGEPYHVMFPPVREKYKKELRS